MYDKLITQWIESHRQEIMDKWMELIRIPSVQGVAEENAPFGVHCDAALQKAASYYQGFPVTVNRKDGYAFAEYGEGEKLIGLFGHSDVVPVGDGWMMTQPFEPTIKDGFLYGRGSCDNKNGVIASWCVLSILKDCNIPLKNRIRAFIGSNEESGMGDITAYVQQEQLPDLALVPDSSFPCSLGEKGILRMWARSVETLQEVQEFKGGSAFNTVLDRVDVKTTKGVEFTTEGVSKHAGSPEGSVNAACLAARKLEDTADGPMMKKVADMLEDPYGSGLGIVHQDEDFGKLTAVNGMVKVEEGHLWVSMDIRYGTSLNPQELEKQLYQVWGESGFEIVEMNNRPGFSVDKDSPIPQLMKDMYVQMTGTERENYRMAGGTYSRYLNNAFTTGTCIPTTPAEPLPAGHGGAHQRDERIDIEGFFRGLLYLVKVVLECDRLL